GNWRGKENSTTCTSEAHESSRRSTTKARSKGDDVNSTEGEFLMNKIYLRIAYVLLLVSSISCGEKKAKRIEEAQLRFQMGQNLLTKGETTQGLVELIAASEMDPENA